MSVSLVDYGLGNLGSVTNMLKRIGVESQRVSTAAEIVASERVLLPGIGSFDTAMRLLHEQNLVDALREFAGTGRPFLGICLGMQLLLDSSEEGVRPGLGLIPGHSALLSGGTHLRVPHMGWNSVTPVRDDVLIEELPAESRFYFVHSYYVVPDRDEDVLATTEYGVPFASMVRSGNIMGAQFHPEKSHAFGMTMLGNFARL